MQTQVFAERLVGLLGRVFWIVRNSFPDAVKGLVGGVVLQHVKNEALFDGLTHRIHVERDRGGIRNRGAKDLERLLLRGRSKREKRQVGLAALRA